MGLTSSSNKYYQKLLEIWLRSANEIPEKEHVHSLEIIRIFRLAEVTVLDPVAQLIPRVGDVSKRKML